VYLAIRTGHGSVVRPFAALPSGGYHRQQRALLRAEAERHVTHELGPVHARPLYDEYDCRMRDLPLS
jgi:hypothetical protein